MKKAMVLSMVLTMALLTGNMASAASYTTYTIKGGDTLWAVSQKFNVSLASVLTANPKIDANNLFIGLQVNIPNTQTGTITSAQGNQYIVQPGENFWIISQKLNIDWNRLVAANPNVTATNMYPGMIINVPASASQVTSTTPTETKTPITSTTPNQYVIQPGDNFWLISQKYNVSVNALLNANPNVDPNNLYVGLAVNIPTANTNTSTNSAVSMTAPTYLADGQFPLKPGTYSPFTDTYGDGRSYNPDGTLQRKHEGDDIMAAKGTPIYSAYDGTVINKGWNTLGGWRLTVKTPDGKTAFYYAHMSAYASGVEIGSIIKKGELIGYVGNTGYGPEGTSGLFDPHLHFGMYDLTKGFVAVDPYNHLKYWEKNSVTANY